jgi:hypothetical protein
VSLTGCRVEHSQQVAMKSVQVLKFHWQSEEVVVRTTVARSELQPRDGRLSYVSGLQFCSTIEESPVAVRHILKALTDHVPAPRPAPSADMRVPFLKLDDDTRRGGTFLECSLAGGRWVRTHVSDLRHPRSGFTIPLPVGDAELDALCRAYESADEPTRSRMRAKIDLSVAATRM